MGACTQPGNIKIVTEKMMTDMEKFLRTTKAQQMQPFMRFTMALDAAKGKKTTSTFSLLTLLRNELAARYPQPYT